MKFSNKLIIISGAFCVFTVALIVAAVFKAQIAAENNVNKLNTLKTPEPSRVQKNISKSIKDTRPEEKYVIKLVNNKICAYIILSDGTHSLWNSMNAPLFLSDEDKEILSVGITTDSFEKLCMYFEAYSD